MSTFDFTEWARAASLSPATKKILSDQSLNDEFTLCNLSVEEVTRLELTIGQEIRLRSALQELGNVHVMLKQVPAGQAATSDQSSSSEEDDEYSPAADSNPPAGSANADTLQQAADALDTYLNVGHQRADGPDTSLATQRCNPKMLLTVKAHTKKAEKIISFLHERTRERIQRRRRERLILSHAEDGTITFKPGEEECFALTISEWGAANMRLLSHLLRKGDLPYTEVELYLSYTMQVHELGDRYEWSSVLEFDTRYRELQAEYGFQWGDMAHCTQFHLLQPRRNLMLHPSSATAAGPKRPTSHTTASPKEDCKRWLASAGKYCPFGQKCKYIHKKFSQESDASSNPKNSQ